MRSLAILFVMSAMFAAPAYAQGRRNSQGVPPGQLPPPGMCLVWYDGVPPGRQPRPMSCREAERLASRDRDARVIYGDDYGNDRYGNERYGNGRYGDDGYGYPDRGGYSYTSVAYDQGYRDGLNKGREDARDRDSFDPVRHKDYRNADRGYDKRYGSKDQYKLAYRDGFERGYEQAYRQNGGRSSGNRNSRFPWPF